MQKTTRSLFHNPLSHFARTMAIMAFAVTALLLLIDYLGVPLNPLIGILTYTLFPAMLCFWLALIPVGMYLEWRRRRKFAGKEPQRFPSFDFNIPSQRRAFYIFILVTSVVGMLVLAVSYRAYHFTESVEFCADICHSVMKPEATTYRSSPHLRVTCVQCHVGEGATWYVKSKLSGLYQVYATLFNKYPRPIETPISSLRPSTDTCERCHWPQKFFGARQILREHFEEDEKNSPRQFYMLLNIGGGIRATGIHWHVGEDEVFYRARDKGRQDIPWVKVKYRDGHESTFVNSGQPLTSEEEVRSEMRKMDCMDCHNRPTHIFQSPRRGLDEALLAGKIDLNLPYVKKLGVELLSKEYESTEAAFQAIRDGVFQFYKEKYPQLAEKNIGLLEKTVEEMRNIYAANNFPEMKSAWSVYTNNIGHLTWPGCFRCHDGQHVNEKGEKIKNECNTCHLFLTEKMGSLVSAETALGKPFEHPVNVGGQDQKMPCTSCHSGR